MKQLKLHWALMIAIAALGVLAFSRPAMGQATNTGTLVGTVTDPSGAVIAGAKLTITNAAAGVALTVTSNANGGFILTTVPPGTYTVAAEKSGFSVSKAEGVVVQVGQQTTLNLKLTVGSAQQTVEVEATAQSLQTLNSTIGQNIGQEAIAALPSINHDVNSFSTLQPGVSPNGSVAGAVNDQSTFLLDGGNATNDMDGGNNVYMGSFGGDPTGGVETQGTGVGTPTGAMPTPQDSVQEMTVNTANQTADFDNSAGAQVEFVTPRGTNRWHGGVYEYYLSSGMGSNTWNNNQTHTPIANYHYNRYGAKAGGWILPAFWGGRTYMFAWYEGYSFPNAATLEKVVPSADMRNGFLTEGGTRYDMKAVDPLGIGISPIMQTLWNKYEPTGNDPSCNQVGSGPGCDGVNTIGYKGSVLEPTSSKDGAIRIDHDFNSKWHWFISYRYYHLKNVSTSQVDLGGFFSGDTKGQIAAVGTRPQIPSYYVTGLTTNLTSNTTNDFHYSILRDYWRWDTNNAPPQLPGLGAALEPGGETSTTFLAPFNVNTQSIRTRFWDGLDNFLSDNVSMLKGNHLLQFGGQYQHNFDYHQRSDNGGGINYTPTYQIGDSAGSGEISLADLQGGYPGGTHAARNAAEVYGMVTDAQQAYTRVGPTLALQPPLTHAFDKSTIVYANAYFSDTWHMKPSFTLTYGMGWTLEMPPTEQQGKQTVLVDSAGEPLKAADFMAQKKAAALQGNSYNPTVAWDLVGNVGNGRKYPYNPFYGSFSPRVSFAWNPSFSQKTVLNGGYARIYGRLNGVDLVLVPLLGDGLMQAVQCRTNTLDGSCASGPQNAHTAFRIGPNGNTAQIPAAAPTAPQPIIPGYNQLASSAAEAMDPSFRPNDIDSFDFTIQRQIGKSSILQIGYIGRLIHHEFLPMNLNNVPYMMSQGGQQFQTAYANLEKYVQCSQSAAACAANVPAAGTPAYNAFISSVPTQGFFEASLKGTGYCNGYANCTAAVLDQELSNIETQQVWGLWSDLDAGNGGANPGFNFARTMEQTPIIGQPLGGNGQNTSGIALNGSFGYGNYNGMFVSFKTSNWHGLTMQNNFTWSKALGTGAFVQASSEYTPNDSFNIGNMYGEQAFDRRLVYNTYLVASEPWFKNQHGLLGRVAGGWQFAPVFTAGSGAPVGCLPTSGTQAQAWGSGDGNNYFDNEQCVFNTKYNAGHSSHYGVTGNATTGVGTAVSKTAVNMFKNPQAVYDQVRTPILGIDTKNPGVGPIMGLPYWNLDAQLAKNFRITEATSFEVSFIAQNVLNHMVFNNPSLDLSNPASWGVLNSQANETRELEFGGRFTF